ncbi:MULTISPECIES: TetR/AcrR family transcriptional regulator [Rhizobium]|uniref:AcrR family transcriptional regulator n=1 Tax=Rhizobium tropici TaxID=398 RepID=A0A6P1C056_RHITR|nr:MULTISPECIES: TetR/AcrR family transcriptional regulator [Rhizobium]AGB72849.1 transcriptional regulator, TetR family [Rhizobium tropici CIAT 899]MBB4241146.1 AcrR family transcriptional regulator [Rhizobium tropici]MBB5592308.1 AcrR family transcriptional regulator [Rhizobium tropici]MBB6491471.1 AcrR family transcriptional regulator [Rhizobium tropici]NEV10480.1 TetR/AcrR family transcriptional regulator [Rhizobium tropici]
MARTVFEKSDAIALVAEVYRELGYEGASMSEITARTKLSKGSLYHFFPGGKEQMAAEIVANIDAWFVTEMFKPLEEEEPRAAIARMWETTDSYFRSGRRVCLIGAFALDETRDRFSAAIRGYFHHWIEALCGALLRGGVPGAEAKMLAEEAVIGIQGALTLARALEDETVFGRTLARLKHRLETALG